MKLLTQKLRYQWNNNRDTTIKAIARFMGLVIGNMIVQAFLSRRVHRLEAELERKDAIIVWQKAQIGWYRRKLTETKCQ